MASVINQIKVGNVEYAIAASAYAECATSSSTTEKVATICTDSDSTNLAFTLIKGVSVNVKFIEANTATNPTLNINSTGAKAIYYKGVAITPSYLKANTVYTFVFNGTRWDFVGELDRTLDGYICAGRFHNSPIGYQSTAEGFNNVASGAQSHAEGYYNTASGAQSHAEGCTTTASNTYAHAGGYYAKAAGTISFAHGKFVTARGESSLAEGGSSSFSSMPTVTIPTVSEIVAARIGQGECSQCGTYDIDLENAWYYEGDGCWYAECNNCLNTCEVKWSVEPVNYGGTFGAYSHSEGLDCVAHGEESHAEGYCTTAGGTAGHAEGYNTYTTGKGAHAQGVDSYATGEAAHASGIMCSATTSCAHALGNCSSASGSSAIAAGYYCKALGMHSVAMGSSSQAQASYSIALGYNAQASDSAISGIAMGYNAKVYGSTAVTLGSNTTAYAYQTVLGKYNKINSTGGQASSRSGDVLTIGNGISNSSKTNAFRVTMAGNVYTYDANGKYNVGSADYAEYFEWFDANTNKEDRRGYFVTMEGDKIKLAAPGDYVLGIVSSHPGVVGNSPEEWSGRYIRDEFGSTIEEECEIDEDVIDPETGERSTVKVLGTNYKENPDYNPELTYIPREDRPEWSAVGMLGVLHVRDDGTCQVNSYCTVAEGGIATASETGYRVISRVNDHIVKVIFR